MAEPRPHESTEKFSDEAKALLFKRNRAHGQVVAKSDFEATIKAASSEAGSKTY